MKQRTIEHIIRHKFDIINGIFDRIVIQVRKKDVHLFRVEIKKLDGFLKLVSATAAANHPITLPKKIRSFYKLLGVIRNLKIQEQRILKSEVNQSLQPAVYLKKVAQKIKRNKKRVKHFSKSGKPFKQEEIKLLRQITGKLNRSERIEYVRMKLKNLQRLIAPGIIEDESLHAVRKSLKDLLYTWPYIKKEASLLIAPSSFPDAKDSLSVSFKLGDFHDMCAGIHLLKHEVFKSKTDSNQQPVLDGLRTKWFKEKEIEKEKLIKLLQKIFARGQDRRLAGTLVQKV